MCLYDFIENRFRAAKIAHCPDICKYVGRKIFGAADPSLARCRSCGNLAKTREAHVSTFAIHELLLSAICCLQRTGTIEKKIVKKMSFPTYSYCFILLIISLRRYCSTIAVLYLSNRKSIYFCCIAICFLYISQFALALLYKSLSVFKSSVVWGVYSLDYSHYHFPFSLIIALSPLTT